MEPQTELDVLRTTFVEIQTCRWRKMERQVSYSVCFNESVVLLNFFIIVFPCGISTIVPTFSFLTPVSSSLLVASLCPTPLVTADVVVKWRL